MYAIQFPWTKFNLLFFFSYLRLSPLFLQGTSHQPRVSWPWRPSWRRLECEEFDEPTAKWGVAGSSRLLKLLSWFLYSFDIQFDWTHFRRRLREINKYSSYKCMAGTSLYRSLATSATFRRLHQTMGHGFEVMMGSLCDLDKTHGLTTESIIKLATPR